ncbi:MAG: hypothetical protein ACKV0T_16295 [Planctomycetales bacterium]
MRAVVALLICGVCGFWSAGCAHMEETRVVKAFSESLKEHDLKQLQAQTSSDFKKQVVQGDETFQALEMINLPDGKYKVVKVKETKDDNNKVTEKRVTVEFGDKRSGRKRVQYLLKPDTDSSKWVVDNVFLSKEDLKANKSVAARASVLLAVRQALDAWHSGEHTKIVAIATPEFAAALEQLSPPHLQRFSRKVMADVAPHAQVLSQERIGVEMAEMRVPKTSSELVLKFRRLDERWRLDDLQVESRRNGDPIASVRHVTSAMSTALVFQNAYRSGDKSGLERTATREFFQGSLANADLSIVSLPGVSTGEEDFDIQLEGGMATFQLPAGDEMLKISLQCQKAEQIHAAPQYLVNDVTIYELNGTQDKRLSALFTGHAALGAFCQALATRDVRELRALSTHDFNQRVWAQFQPEYFQQLDGVELTVTRPRIVQTVFKGSMIEVLVEENTTPLTYVLRDEGGRMLMDDVLSPAANRPESLKQTAELLIPVLEFASALKLSDLDMVRGRSTEEFSRLAWNNYREAPEFEHDPLPHLQGKLSRLNLKGDRVELLLGSETQGAQVTLLREEGQFRVDDVTLISGPDKAQREGLRQAVRRQLANRR